MYKFNMAVYIYLQGVLFIFSICALYIAGLDVCEDKSTNCQPCNLQYPVPSPTRENCMKTCQVCTGVENVALNKTANQVSTQFGGVASNAVDGRITVNNTNGNICTHTYQISKQIHWWCVDLGKMYNINNVTIYNRAAPYDDRLQGFRLNTATNGQCNQQGFDRSTPCYRDTPDRIVDIYTVDNCNLHSNKSISAGTNTIFIWNDEFVALVLCEVQVYTGIACSYGYYSTSSSTCEPCNDGCSDNKCNPDTGDCIGNCKSGFYGTKCNLRCTGCVDTCTKDTGVCNGECKSGFYGNKCDQSCTGCLEKCVKDTGDCFGECKRGLYGTRCNETCSDGCSTSICSKGGSCSCRNGFYTTKCSFECSSNCKNRSCTSSPPPPSSSPVQCTDGCVDGYKGSYCQTPCDVNCRRCDVVSCTVCKPGWYGDNCESRCPTGCKETCNKTSGTCDECKEGTVGLYCNSSCIDECRPIENAVMKPSTCVRGLYGDVCTRKCSQLCRQRECQQETGTCIFGCIGGGKIADCSSDVSEGENEASISPVGVGIIGVFVGGLVFGVAVGVIVYICMKRRSYTDQEQTTEANATPLEEQVSNSTESANYYSSANSRYTHYQNQSYHENTYDSLKHVNNYQNTD